jgi:hypothetical protein
MIERTRTKLDEARFFYRLLVNERPQTMKAFGHDPRAFRYYFSAFIQAARSVTWTLGNEEPENWKAWKPTWEASRSPEEQRLLDLTNDLRTDEVHRGGTDPSVELEEVALQELLRSVDFDLERQHPAHGIHRRSAILGVPQPKVFRQTYYFEDEVGKEEVTALCKRYLDFLDKMLNDFCTDNQRASPR